MGISLQIVGSQVAYVYYGFYCSESFRNFYCSVILLFGTVGSIMTFWDKFRTEEMSVFRLCMAFFFVMLSKYYFWTAIIYLFQVTYISTGLFAIIPFSHLVLITGMQTMMDLGFFNVILGCLFYTCGGIIYACHLPERLYPGVFDLVVCFFGLLWIEKNQKTDLYFRSSKATRLCTCAFWSVPFCIIIR